MMFYWPYQFRHQTSFLVPKGPHFRRASAVSTCVNGSYISINLPSNQSRSHEKPINPEKNFSLRNNDFKACDVDHPGWEIFTLIGRKWDFNGSWFTGRLGRLSLRVNVVRRLRHSPTVSFFHPRAFEATISDLMSFYHGGTLHYDKTVQKWFAPINWQPLKGFPCIAARFEAVTNPEAGRPERCLYLFLPISDEYLLQISMPITRVLPFIHSSVEPEDDTDAWISEEPMKELADQILDSLQVRLSPEAEQQQARAVERLSAEERALIKEFPPLKWVS